MAVTLLVGCTDSSRRSAPKVADADPAVSFDNVVQNLRHYLRQLQTEPYLDFKDGAYTEITSTRQVTDSKIHSPTAEGTNYRGTITVVTKWTYSYRPPIETPDGDAATRSAKAKSSREQSSTDSLIPSGIEAIDSDLIANIPSTVPRDSTALVPQGLLQSQADEEARIFELVYHKDRWEVVAEPKPIDQTDEELLSTDGALEEAMALALRRQ